MHDILIAAIREALGQRGRAMNTAAIPTLIAGLHPSDLAFILDASLRSSTTNGRLKRSRRSRRRPIAI